MGNLIASLDFLLRVTLIPRELINHGTNFDVLKGKDCGFVADWLKTKGLHKLCSVFEVIKNHFILSMNI